MRLLFMGTPAFAVPTLKALLSSHHKVSAVFTQPDKPSGRGEKLSAPPVKQLAVEHDVIVHQPEKLKAAEWQSVFAGLNADAYVVVAYGKILPQWLLDLPRLGAYNVHASLLPKYRGAAPIHWAIANGETRTGITTMKLDAGMDTGDMLLQTEIPIDPEDTCVSIHDRLAAIGAELMLKTLEDLEKGTAKRHSPRSRAGDLCTDVEKIRWPARLGPACRLDSQSNPSVQPLARNLHSSAGANTPHLEGPTS